MSIFQDTLSPIVQNQLKAREIIVSQASGSTYEVSTYGNVPRDDRFMRYVSGKNSWVRMTSFVDCVELDKNGKNIGLKIGSETYFGDALAKKYILEGGTLFSEQYPNLSLRSGVQYNDSVYNSNLDFGGYRDQGARPMPGITSVRIINKSAYGSLREATVKFYAWDKHQLEELELLYMRTGYSVLLEWGWSQYLDSSNLNDIKIKNFDEPLINPFSLIVDPTNKADDGIYQQIDTISDKVYGNYDGMLGYIKNFSWQLMPNGGYDCTTVLISRGEVITNLKLNTNSSVIDLSTSNNNADKATLTQFEGILLNYSALLNSSELEPGGQFAAPTGGGVNILSNQVNSISVNKLLTDLKEKAEYTTTGVSLYDDKGDRWNNIFKQALNTGSLNYLGGTLITKDTVNTPGGYGIEYIRLDMLVALINIYFNFKDGNNQTVADIRIPNNNVCLATKDTVSADPFTCIIKNSRAKGILLDLKGKGFIPSLVKGYDRFSGSNPSAVPVKMEEFLVSGKTNRGYIKHIYVAIPKVLEIFRSKINSSSEASGVDLFKDLLSQISRALGGVNNFQLHTTKSSAQIIDVRYLEENSKPKQKYEFDLMGLRSICRNVKINSRIFESQSTMIAIAAQNNNNIGDIYSSTQVYLNKGLQDRLISEKRIWKDSTDKEFIETLYRNISQLGFYLRTKVMGDPTLVPPPTPSFASFSPPPFGVPPPTPSPTPTPGSLPTIGVITLPTSDEITNAVSVLKSFLYQLRGDDLKYKAIIPFELEITLDGIGGLVQGQVFRINQNILPQSYIDKDLGFIITGISHNLQNNDWTTNVTTQICVLDPDNKDYPARNYDYLIQKLIALSKLNQLSTYISLAIVDYLTNIFVELIPKVIENYYQKYISPPGGYIEWIENTNPAPYYTQQIGSGTNGAPSIPSVTFASWVKNTWYPAKQTELAAVGINSYKDLITVGGQTFNVDMVDYLTYDYKAINEMLSQYNALNPVPDPNPVPSGTTDQNINKIFRNAMFIGRDDDDKVLGFDVKTGGVQTIDSESKTLSVTLRVGVEKDLVQHAMPGTRKLFDEIFTLCNENTTKADKTAKTLNPNPSSGKINVKTLTFTPNTVNVSDPRIRTANNIDALEALKRAGMGPGFYGIEYISTSIDKTKIWDVIAIDVADYVMKRGNTLGGATNFGTDRKLLYDAASKVRPVAYTGDIIDLKSFYLNSRKINLP